MTENKDQGWQEDIVAPDGGDSIHIPGWQEDIVAPDGGDSISDPERDGIEGK